MIQKFLEDAAFCRRICQVTLLQFFWDAAASSRSLFFYYYLLPEHDNLFGLMQTAPLLNWLKWLPLNYLFSSHYLNYWKKKQLTLNSTLILQKAILVKRWMNSLVAVKNISHKMWQISKWTTGHINWSKKSFWINGDNWVTGINNSNHIIQLF